MVIWGVFAVVMDFGEVMLTSPPELAHCAPHPPPSLVRERSHFPVFFLTLPLLSNIYIIVEGIAMSIEIKWLCCLLDLSEVKFMDHLLI